MGWILWATTFAARRYRYLIVLYSSAFHPQSSFSARVFCVYNCTRYKSCLCFDEHFVAISLQNVLNCKFSSWHFLDLINIDCVSTITKSNCVWVQPICYLRAILRLVVSNLELHATALRKMKHWSYSGHRIKSSRLSQKRPKASKKKLQMDLSLLREQSVPTAVGSDLSGGAPTLPRAGWVVGQTWSSILAWEGRAVPLW